MHNITIPDRNITISLPEHWDEFETILVEGSEKFDKSVSKAIHYCLSEAIKTTNGQQSIADCKIKCFYRLAGIKRTWKSIMLEKIMPAEWTTQKNSNINQVAEQTITFLFSEHHAEVVTLNGHPEPVEGRHPEGGRPVPVEGPLEISYNTIFNYFPTLKPKPFILQSIANSQQPTANSQWSIANSQKTIYGPSHMLTDLSFGEFRSALEELDEYFHLANSQQPKAKSQLNRFIATLYRPERAGYQEQLRSETFDGQRREPFNRNRIDINARYAAHIDHVTKTAILLWFTYCINYLQTEELEISGRTISLRPLFPRSARVGHPEGGRPVPVEGQSNSQKPKANSQNSWLSILYTLAKEGPFGSIDQTEKVGLLDVLVYMYDQYQQTQRLKSQSKKKT
ncbi:MAG: hypothetical protein ABJG41_01350 [Cyclobacteriaceae bacterium]